jgi:hypothetical protein
VRRVIIGTAVVLLVFAAATVYVLLRSIETDKLCTFVRGLALSCPTLVADPVTIRPGGIVREVPDPTHKGLMKVDLPSAYLDNETCLIPGAKLAPWSPHEEQSFSLPTFSYDFSSISRIGGQVPLPAVQGVDIDADASASRVSRISLSFGPARTRLLDENVLLNRIESCEILPRCVDRIRQNRYLVVNRVVEVEGMSYSFEDSAGARIPLGLLLENKTIRAVNSSFDISQKNGTSLNSAAKMVIALTTIDSAAFSKVQTCTAPVVFSFEGNSRATVGGGGRPGFIPPQAPVTAKLGQEAKVAGRGSEDHQGDMEQTTSSALAWASVSQADSQSLRVTNTVQIQGGHYGVRGPLGIGIASGHDTSANAEAINDGRINVLLRTPGALLNIAWQGFAVPSAAPVAQQAEMQVEGPQGTLETIPNIGSSGTKTVRLPAEGYYSVIVRNFARAEGSGWSARASIATDATVRVSIQPE